ncbi:probable serine/threonine-protein kinase nek3 [Neodiprion lecontei]|uniref:Probable serine/threonine-protein kinase nek3 n=1 Tax=Neodiprion lecontei TaxID=441921 RepID=A0ABM3GMW2_NEOLC|nr:probable serine/threonine-protein kinase nek3 [Neodiprion lecontei]
MVRKRKHSSDESGMPAPQRQFQRLTRKHQRTLIDDDNENAEALPAAMSNTSSKTMKTPSTASGRNRKSALPENAGNTAVSTRSRRRKPTKSSSDSDSENKAESPIGQLKLDKVNTLQEPEIANRPLRSRLRKEMNDNISGTSVAELKPQQRNVTDRKKRVLAVADNTLTENWLVLIETPVKLTRLQAKTFSAKKKPDPSYHSKLPGQSDEIQDADENKNREEYRKVKETPRKSFSKEQEQSLPLGIVPIDTVTPESSPMLVTLTPHRSSKTPKKSPLNIGSPKTHSYSPLRLSKTPRKLPITVESPATSDKSSVSIGQTVQETQTTSMQVDCNNPFVALMDFRKELSDQPSVSPKVSKSRKTSALKTPSKRLPTPASKVRKSPVKTPAALQKSGLLVRGRISTPVNVKRSSLSQPESPRRPKSTAKKRSPITSSGTPLRPIPVSKEAAAAIATSSPFGVPPNKIKALLELAETSPTTTPRSRIRRSLNLTSDFITFSSGSTSSPMITPQRISQVMENKKESRPSDDESLGLIAMSDDMFDDSSKAKDGTYELSVELTLKQKEKNAEKISESGEKDATYELAEPKTPSLQKSRKRSFSAMEPSNCTPDAKKRCRVRFASPAQKTSTSSPALGTSSVRKSVRTVQTPARHRIGVVQSARRSRGSVGMDSQHRRSRSLTKGNEINQQLRSSNKRRSNSASNLLNKTPKFNQTIQDSINRLSRPRQPGVSTSKTEAKVPAPRRIPNFAQIHQKKFAQMESLVDVKERVAKRHVEFSTVSSARTFQPLVSDFQPLPSTPKPAPTTQQSEGYNRFGFKLRKVEARTAIKKNPPSSAVRNKNIQDKNRSILQGVRTNRRFELQMKSRNLH